MTCVGSTIKIQTHTPEKKKRLRKTATNLRRMKKLLLLRKATNQRRDGPANQALIGSTPRPRRGRSLLRGGRTKKRRTARKKANRIKKPKTAYIFFYETFLHNLKPDFDIAPHVTEFGGLAGAAWNAADPETKSVYRALAAADKERYVIAVKAKKAADAATYRIFARIQALWRRKKALKHAQRATAAAAAAAVKKVAKQVDKAAGDAAAKKVAKQADKAAGDAAAKKAKEAGGGAHAAEKRLAVRIRGLLQGPTPRRVDSARWKRELVQLARLFQQKGTVRGGARR